ncbi:XRE family transcriptional regulator [Saccharopolyspora rhizosphaerae]|uniref:XRE family transcriptional regulator n=1 Tax=Saccharopolyspora rhizosphaerae TaxID=2492662 RepID=A0A3R8NZ28_9PSEU|nr:helix-turn-helix transcriptional regulator [Saccharopolyspora rhizosphaerae]RRO12930.1 XRE family transcriptional regulator [Saccharopolyspora rhizosphaerae]
MADTPRARALARELRAARSATGLTARELSRLLGWSEAKVSRLETARRGIRVESVEAMLKALKVRGAERERLLTMAREIREPAWWEVGRGIPDQLTALLDVEQRAQRITSVQLNLVPGLLQTEEYAREIMTVSGVPSDDVDEHVSIRLKRQGILAQSNPVELRVLIDETVFMRPVGGPRVMAEQLRHVQEVNRAGNVEIRVLPRSIGAHAGLSGAFVLFEFERSRPVVYIEARRSGAFIDAPGDVSLFVDSVGLLESQASDRAGSRAILDSYLLKYESEAE